MAEFWDTTVAPLPQGRRRHGAATDDAGRVYAVGGQTVDGWTTDVRRYNSTTDTWEAVAPLPAALTDPVVTGDGDGHIYVIGTTSYRYDTATNTWTTISSPSSPTSVFEATHDNNGRIYIIGKSTSGHAFFRRYDPATNTWTTLPEPPTDRGSSECRLERDLDGRIYAIGSESTVGAPGIPAGAGTIVERYDPATNTWTSPTSNPIASLPTSRYDFTTALDSIGRIYAIGGRNSDGSVVFDVVERYDPTTDTWATLSSLPMPTARSGAAATADGIGNIFVIGGRGNSADYLTTVEVFASNHAPDAPTLTAPADGETADRQQDQTFRWQFNDIDQGDTQSAYNFAYRPVGATTWTETGWVTSTSSKHVLSAGTFALGDYEWRVRTKDAQGLESPWSVTGFFTAGDRPPGPSITDPANNQVLSEPQYEVVWSTPDQDAYRLRVLDGTTVVYDTGQVDSTTARSRVVEFPDNNVTRIIEVTVLSGGLWSPASTVTVTVSYTPPAEPTVALTSDDATGSLIVTTTVQTPAVGEPTVTGIDVWIREAGTAGDGLRVAADVPPSLAVTWWLPVSGVDYEARVRAIGDNGASTWSQWYGRAPLTVAVYGQSTYDNAIYA